MSYLPDGRVTHIVIHYSATPIEKDFTAADIDRMHRTRGFNEIGYHYFIRKDGTVETGRDLGQPGRFEQGAHAKGNNASSIGICFEGGVRAAAPNVGFDSRTPAQIAAMIKLIRTVWLVPKTPAPKHPRQASGRSSRNLSRGSSNDWPNFSHHPEIPVCRACYLWASVA
ncbi:MULTISPECIES: N-acetylmuramoyl-L-alanine amidase [unclassified Sulfitobacter]|jgi:N-acetyl-anhydromuramyl-L-alanine amidase AmpD|uniref:N-acetylmuramoyl-L-alanine amidase n=1 Tax=unclassified Sulfitobacter TaxID=196795 RepID=UPI000B0993DF|nr:MULTISPECIES: N-acetylmuramoyl-L-alanine amidase [unclassified Sulfitobacter]